MTASKMEFDVQKTKLISVVIDMLAPGKGRDKWSANPAAKDQQKAGEVAQRVCG